MEAGPAIQLQDQVARQAPALLAPLQQALLVLLVLLVHLFQPQRDHHLELQLKINIAQEHKLLLPPHPLLNSQGTSTSTTYMEIKEHPPLRLPPELLLKLSQAPLKLHQEIPKQLQQEQPHQELLQLEQIIRQHRERLPRLHQEHLLQVP